MTTERRNPPRRLFARFGSTALLAALLGSPVVARAGAPCGEWELLPTPNVGNSANMLTAVTAIAPNDAWAVGLWRSEPVGRGPLAMRWNGSVWTATSLPNTSSLGVYPETAGVSAASNGDVWIVGDVTTTYPTYNMPLVMRWRGGNWDLVETVPLRPQTVYPFAARGGLAYDVDAVAPDDIWAVGQAVGFGDGGATSVPLAMHWDGSNWTDVEVPRVANRHHALNDVVAIASDDVWAVGDYRNVADIFRGVTYHWDGENWSHVDSPIEHMGSSGLDDVAASGPNDVWAIGGSDGAVILMHWDGSQWSVVDAPTNSGGSLTAVGPNDLWVSGWNGFFHWDGLAWTEVPTTIAGASYTLRSGGMVQAGDCDILCVGFWTLSDGTTGYTLAERLQPATVSVPGSGVEASPVGASLAASHPNPFLDATTIRYSLARGGAARLVVFDASGRRVRTLFDRVLPPGSGELTWDGTAEDGATLPAGAYFLRLESPEGTSFGKLTRVR